MEGGGLRAYGSGFRTLLGWDSAASRSASVMKWGPGRGGGLGRSSTGFYWNISRNIENSARYFCISNNIQYVTKIHNRIGFTCLVYCLSDPK